MAEKLLVELQDDKGNIFYLHTSSAAVFCADGKTVQEKIGTVKGRITTKENLKLVTEANYLPEAKAVKDYFDELNGKLGKMELICVKEGANYQGFAIDTTKYNAFVLSTRRNNGVPLASTLIPKEIVAVATKEIDAVVASFAGAVQNYEARCYFSEGKVYIKTGSAIDSAALYGLL